MTCTCRPVTAAGVMVSDPRCPVHGTPPVTFTVAPGFDGLTGKAVMTYAPAAGETQLLRAAKAAYHALKSYQYGNAAPDLAEKVTAVLLDAIAKAEGRCSG